MKINLLDTFITGHPLIDAEHREIVSAINEVSAAVSAGEFERCPPLLDNFLGICKAHFKSEEGLLERLGFPNLQEHIDFHNELLLKARAVRVLCMDVTQPNHVQRCFEEMATLLIEDVIKGDLQFVSFLIEKGEVDRSTRLQVPS